MNNVYNSVNEVSLRLLIILYNCDKPISSDRLVGLDFLAVYGKEFQISNTNLHGDNKYKFSELPSRREIIGESIKYLVINDLIKVSLVNGFEYSISDKGAEYVSNLKSAYSISYNENVCVAIEKVKELDDMSILKLIQSKSTVQTLRKEE